MATMDDIDLKKGRARATSWSAPQAPLVPLDVENQNGGGHRHATITFGAVYRPEQTMGKVIVPSRQTVDLLYQQVKLKKLKDMQPKLEGLDDHMLSIEALAERYGVSLDAADPKESQGLTVSEAKKRLEEEGANEITPPPVEWAVIAFIKLLRDPLTVMLIVAAVLSLVSQAFANAGDLTPTYLGLVLIVVILANTMVDFIQGRKSAAMLKSLGNLAPPKAMVKRDGVIQDVNAAVIVRGDLVVIKSGDKMPADLRLIHVVDLSVDNSNLTGEVDPQKRAVEADHPQVLEAENLAFMGTTVVKGSGYGIVIKRGDDSILGQISNLAGSAPTDVESPLTVEISAFVILIAIASLILAIVVFGAAMGLGNSFIISLSLFIGVFVACTPQGLPATATMLLAYAAKELSKHNVLVKNLHAVDTLGAITLLCSDKTGTLTMNRMTVVSIWEDLKEVIQEADRSVERDICLCIVLCNTAAFRRSAENMALPVATREVIGDATETALLRYVSSLADSDALRSKYSSARDIPFDSDRKWAGSIRNKPHANGHYTAYLKGAPERVLKRCKFYMLNGEMKSTDDAGFKAAFDKGYKAMAGKGQRVIACAVWLLDGKAYGAGHNFDNFDEKEIMGADFVFLGMTGLQDPPKPGVPEAVDSCNLGGIQVMMITGDHPLTACAIAREVHIIKGKTRADVAEETGEDEHTISPDRYDAIVLHGDEIVQMSEDDWAAALKKREVVFARTSPQQKLEIVTRAQAMGHVVAMTGDGVNDSPALRRANMGIAMAITGSDVSREAASLVLLDDNFVSIVEGIKRGRTIFANMKKAIMFTLAHLVAELIPSILVIAIGLPLGLSSFLILMIDLVTEIGPALSLAREPAADDVMTRPPRRSVRPRDVVVMEHEVRDLQTNTSIQIEHEIGIDGANDSHALGDLAGQLKRQPKLIAKLSAALSGLKKSFRGEDLGGDELLLDWPVLRFSYLQTGFIETAWALLVYFVTFNHYGISPSELYQMAPNHFPSKDDSAYINSSGQVFDSNRQDEILASVGSSYFFSVVIMQFFTCYLMKATDNPFWSKRAWINKTSYPAMLFSLGCAFFVVFTPGVQTILSSRGFPWWVPFLCAAGGFVHITVEGTRMLLEKRKKNKTS